MNYYIQGDAANADKIKAAFDAKGYHTGSLDYGDELFFFFSMNNGHIRAQRIPGCNKDYEACLIDIIKTHPDYKELELPVEPKFKVGDKIIWNEPKGSKPAEPVKIIQLIDKDQLYMVDMPNGVGYVAYDMQDYYKLVPKPHYDIKNFHAGMPVLVRDYVDEEWRYVQFSHIRKPAYALVFNAGCNDWYQCIPFEGNEHLLGTTDMCDEMYINW